MISVLSNTSNIYGVITLRSCVSLVGCWLSRTGLPCFFFSVGCNTRISLSLAAAATTVAFSFLPFGLIASFRWPLRASVAVRESLDTPLLCTGGADWYRSISFRLGIRLDLRTADCDGWFPDYKMHISLCH